MLSASSFARGDFVMKNNEHIISDIEAGSIAEEMGIEKGDVLLMINDTQIEDVFDYRYLMYDENLEVLIKKADGEEWLLEIEKDYDEDLGLIFESGLMDDYRRCYNNCIFCFIDQMPKGMRETLYFKDDDSRLSFLQGNYITLTNMADKDIDKIIKYNLSPINISFQTTNPELRCKMLNNKFAGDALKKVDKLYEAGITMNGQIVLCKGINDKDELKQSLADLLKYAPVLESVSIVPVGLTKYRDGLYPLEAFTKEDAIEVIDTIEHYRDIAYSNHELHLFHASDEFYILAERDIPKSEEYDGYLQIENGVGMIRNMIEDYTDMYNNLSDNLDKGIISDNYLKGNILVITGELAYPFVKECVTKFEKLFYSLKVDVKSIKNDFFGDKITVSGLVTGGDIIRQLKGKLDGVQKLFIPECMLKADEPIFLDDVSLETLEKTLQVPVYIVKSTSDSFIENIRNEMRYE